MMHGREKSDSVIVAEKPTNKVLSATGGAGGAKGGGQGECEPAKHASDTVPQALERIRQVRRHSPKVGAVCGPTALRLGFFSLWTQSEPARLTEIGGLCMLLPIDSICPDMDLTLFERE